MLSDGHIYIYTRMIDPSSIQQLEVGVRKFYETFHTYIHILDEQSINLYRKKYKYEQNLFTRNKRTDIYI
jgi:hypothetical protein